MALTNHYSEHHGKAAMISNDLGHGVNLADHRLAVLAGCNASEMTETCICYQNENLAQRLDYCYEEGCDLVISDIPGFGVGALEHVYHGLNEKFPGRYELAPFTVLIEPDILALLRDGKGGDMQYILHTQLVEADLILLNKCDTISEEQIDADRRWLLEQYPQAEVLAISALEGTGLEELSLALKKGNASMRRPEIGYGGGEFMNSMGRICEYYLQYHAVVCCNTFDGTAYLMDIAQMVQEKLQSAGEDVPHLKLLAWEPEGDYGKVDLVGKNREIVKTRAFQRECTDIAVILNASALCSGDRFAEVMQEAVETVSGRYQLDYHVFKEEHFGMGG